MHLRVLLELDRGIIIFADLFDLLTCSSFSITTSILQLGFGLSFLLHLCDFPNFDDVKNAGLGWPLYGLDIRGKHLVPSYGNVSLS